MDELRFRQIHLDFHTSEAIDDIGINFDAQKFADTLDKARVNSITCFARGHHGWLYYRSKNFPELVHPHLKCRDLLEQQVDACHAKGIRVPVYTTVQWDYHQSHEHPEWCCLNPDGSFVDDEGSRQFKLYDASFYRRLCVNTGYRDFLKAQVKDIFESIGPDRVDGLFFDIVGVVDCSCPTCVRKMKEKGYDPEIATDRRRYGRELLKEFREDMSDYCHTFKKDISIYYNAGHINHVSYDAKDAYSHFELESLPSGDWGYGHFLNTVRYARCTGKDIISQTGKFHTMWGDFHSFKNVEALKCETNRMLAYNCKCMIGDQLNPDGAISEPVYDLVGKAYTEIEKKEPWCFGAKALTDLAVLTPEFIIYEDGYKGAVPPCVQGCTTMLDELGIQFDIIEPRFSFDNYKVIILPDEVTCDDELRDKLEDFVKKGGKIIATASSGLNREKTAFNLPSLGLEYLGERDYYPDFIIPNDRIGKNLPVTEHVMYIRGQKARSAGADVMLSAVRPYFNRTWEHFCSHRHTPSSGIETDPAMFSNGNTMWFAHPIFTTYFEKHPAWCKAILKDALEMYIPEQLIKHNGPSTMTNTINEQEKEKRYVAHLMHYIPVKSCRDLFTIEDVIPLYNIEVSFNLPRKVRKAVLVPEGKEIGFRYENGRLVVDIDKIEGHRMVEFDWE